LKICVNKFKDSKILWNFACFISMISFDLKVITQDMVLSSSKNEWQRRYYIRQACLIICESTDSIFDLLGKDFKSLTLNELNSSEYDSELLRIRKKLNTFKDSYYQKFREVRNMTAAHRDKDVLKQLEIIQNLCWTDSVKIIFEFNDILKNLGKYLTCLVKMSFSVFEEFKKNINFFCEKMKNNF